MKSKRPQAKQISNRRARHDYDLGDGLVVGLELSGAEVKSLRRGHGHLRGAYVNVKDGELWLFNATISGDNAVRIASEDQTRTRKILAKRREIEDLIANKQQGQSIVPLELLTQGRYIKLRIASGRGKKKYDKREALKRKDQQRDVEREFKTR